MRIVKDTLRKRAAEGKTVFMSTHTLGVAEEIAHRIGVIFDGRLLFLGSVGELRDRLSLGESTLEDLYLALTESSVSPQASDTNGRANGQSAGPNGASTMAEAREAETES